MSTVKKDSKIKMPDPAKDARHKGGTDFEQKGRNARDEKKVRRVNYVVKDLPIY